MTRRLLRCLFVIYLTSLSHLYAQEAIDSLKNMPPEALIDAIKNAEPEEAAVYEKELYIRTYADTIFYNIGYHFYKEEKYERSNYYLNNAIKLAEKSKNDHVVCKAYAIKGHSYMLEWNNEEALELYELALEIARKNSYLEEVIDAVSGKAIIFGRMDEFDKALKACKEMLSLIDKTRYKDGKNHVNILAVTSETYMYKKQYDSALYYFEKGIDLSEAINYREGLVDLYIKKGRAFYHNEEYDKAFDFLSKAETILSEEGLNNMSFQKIDVNYFLARCYYIKELYREAIRLLETMINSLKEEDLIKERIVDSHRLLYLCYLEIEDNKKVRYWANEYEKLDFLFHEDKKETVNKIRDREKQQDEKEIERLKNERKKDKKILRNTIIASIVIVLILLIILVNYIKKQRSNKTLFNNLLEKIAHLESAEKIQSTPIKEAPKTITIDDDKVHKILNGLTKLEQQEYFLNLECNIRMMAKKIKTNATYLSTIINNHKGKSFNDYINELRIKYVLKRLKNDERFRLFSVKAIAAEIGYKSENSFTKHFRSKTGLNPSYYIKNLNKLEESNRSKIY